MTFADKASRPKSPPPATSGSGDSPDPSMWEKLFGAKHQPAHGGNRLLIVVADPSPEFATACLELESQSHKIVGLVADSPSLLDIAGFPLLGAVEDIPQLVERERVDTIAIAARTLSSAALDRILCSAERTAARIRLLSSPAEITRGQFPGRLRDVTVDDLVGRPSDLATMPITDVGSALSGRTILVTGAPGSVGSELCRQLLRLGPSRLIALDNNEKGLTSLARELVHEKDFQRLTVVLADITDDDRIGHVFRRYRPDVVFHAAAYRDCRLLESHPEEAVFVNVHGTLNLCRMAAQHDCKRLIFTSENDTADASGVLGSSKRIAELIVRSYSSSSTAFSSIRFGPVFDDPAGPLPDLVRQIDAGRSLTLADPEEERSLLTRRDLVRLIIEASVFAGAGELYQIDMSPCLKTRDLVNRILRLRARQVDQRVPVVEEQTPREDGVRRHGREQLRASTPNPSVFQIHDDAQPDPTVLHRSVITLVQLARLGEPVVVAEALHELASSQTAQSSPGRLRVLATAVEKAVASASEASEDSLEAERRSGLERRTVRERRGTSPQYTGPERRRNVLDRRVRVDRRRVVTALMRRFQDHDLPA